MWLVELSDSRGCCVMLSCWSYSAPTPPHLSADLMQRLAKQGRPGAVSSLFKAAERPRVRSATWTLLVLFIVHCGERSTIQKVVQSTMQ